MASGEPFHQCGGFGVSQAVDILYLIRQFSRDARRIAVTRKSEEADGDTDSVADQESGLQREIRGSGNRNPEVSLQGHADLPEINRPNAQV
jgi:hypothetical protein